MTNGRNSLTQDSRHDPALDRPPAASHRAPTIGAERAVRLALWIAAAWALSAGLYLLHIAWVVPLVVLLGTASLMRGLRSLLDRVVLATALLYGTVCVVGLLLSVWPWRLHPVAVGGLALTTLVVFAHLTRRRPSLPRPTLADGLSLAAAGVVGLVVGFPMLWRGQEARIATLVVGEDGIRHFIQLDTVRQVGGYLFVHEEVTPLMSLYPHGWHFFFGLLDGFVRSSTELGSGLSALDHYIGYAVLTYAAFALALIWGIQRLAEPLLTPARRLVLVAVGVAYMLSDEAFLLSVLNFTSQIAGLALMVVLVAVLVRPPARTALTLWLVSALLIGVGFTYTLYLPPAVLFVMVWLYARRRRVVRHRFALVGTLLAALLAAGPLVIGLTLGNQIASLQAPTGTMWSVDGTLVLAGVVAAGLMRSWRAAHWRAMVWTLGLTVLCLVGIYVLVWTQGGSGGSFYYAFKVRHLLLALLVLGIGALLAWLPAPQRREDPWRWRDLGTWRPALGRLVPALAVSVALAAGSGLIAGDSPYATRDGAVFARGWVGHQPLESTLFLPRTAVAEERREVAPGTITVVMLELKAPAFLAQTLVSGLKRQYRDIVPGLYGTPYIEPDHYDSLIEALPPRPVLIVVDTERARQAAEELAARHPDRDITIAFTDR
jgi:hypothetical protein